MFSYYFLRFSGPLLFVLVGLKILSGYSLVGRPGGISWLASVHESRGLDILLLASFFLPMLVKRLTPALNSADSPPDA